LLCDRNISGLICNYTEAISWITLWNNNLL
jgi:hypothetical protein